MKEITILDCENYDSMILSLETIFTTSGDDLSFFLKSVDLNEIWEKSPKSKQVDEYLFDKFINEFKIDNSQIIKAYWFHNTRVLKGTKFEEGILPLSMAINKIELILNEIIKKLEIPISNTPLSECSIIQDKLNSKINQGPWAFLIRDFAFENTEGIHNYLQAPELIEDILNFRYPGKYDLILSEYQKETVKCIVKFRTEREFCYQRLIRVINYLYNKINNESMDWRANANFSNEGEIISPSMILKIDYIEDRS